MGKRGGPSKRHLIEPYKDQLGKVPDKFIAEQAGVSPGSVYNFRNELGIAAYKRPSKAKAGKGSDRPRKASKGAKAAKPARAAKSPSKGKQSKKKRKGSVLDDYIKVMGTMPDRIIADTAGVSRSAVAAYRRRHGISASSNSGPKPKGTKGGPAAVPKPAANAKPRATRRTASPKPASTKQWAWEVTFDTDNGSPAEKRGVGARRESRSSVSIPTLSAWHRPRVWHPEFGHSVEHVAAGQDLVLLRFFVS